MTNRSEPTSKNSRFNFSMWPHQVHKSDEDAVCRECFDLGSHSRFIQKICGFVHSLDEAQLLHKKMFAPETVNDFISSLQQLPNYSRRSKSLYDASFKKDVKVLHHRVMCVWNGRVGQPMTEALNLFRAQVVQPCLDTEPGHPIPHKCLDRLLQFLTNDPQANSFDVSLVRSIVTGQLSRHPAMQGVLVACMTKLQNEEEGKKAMRNSKRSFANHV